MGHRRRAVRAYSHRRGRSCPAPGSSIECLSYALDARIEHGIWGGTTDRERPALLRRRPTVSSWRRLLDAARSEHEGRHRRGDAERGTAAG
ncbi:MULTISPECIES: WhiB family transcriptional regulator [Streptomyces]|uniref:WhiB family transcriptional regulator n=1 Tax=Streptomyces TaxID=1883 RepID=UPI001D0B70D6|nr:WhiB family transcriptional regulator [Streptomyces longhuiensis]UDM04849.1 WhiB family transcriptional regulator [Streptomyces longhuiensis]